MPRPNSPSPPPRHNQPLQSKPQLPNSPTFSTPSFSSTLPLPRSNSASGAFRRTSLPKKGRLAPSQRSRLTRSVASSAAHSSDGSLGDFSMENYTVDLAQLGRKEGVVRPVGFEQAFNDRRTDQQTSPKQRDIADGDGDGDGDGDAAGDAGGEDEDEDEDEDGDRRKDADADDDGYENEGDDFMDGYEVDLAGLGDKPSSVLVEDGVYLREEVPSEDEGPEDFTQNLEAWMRGSKKWKREQTEDIAEGHEPDPDPEQDLRKSIIGNGIAEESAFEPLGTSTPAPLRNHAIIEEGVEEEAKLQAPPLTRLNTEMLQEKAAEEVFDRISALQAEVESMRLEDEARRAAHQALEEEHEEMRTKYESARKDDRNKYDALRSEHDQLQREHIASKESLRRENKDLTLEYNNVIGQLRVSENQATSDRGTKVEMLRAKYEPAFQELGAVKAQAELDRNAAESQIVTLSRDLKASRDESSSRKFQMDTMQETNSVAVKHLETELEAREKEVALERKESIDRANEAVSLAESNSRTDNKVSEMTNELEAIKKELRHAQEQLTETRRIVDIVEGENDRLVQENLRQAEQLVELEATVRGGKPADAETAPVTDSQITIDQATHKAVLEELSHQHQISLTSLGADHGKEIQTLHKALQQADQDMRKREAQLAKEHQDQVASLHQQIATFTQRQAKVSDTSGPLEEELRSAIRVLGTKLEKANAIAKSARSEAEEARQQADDAQQANAIVNAEMESRFVETVEEREKEWRRRIDLLFREREKMGKALMWGWGREELGPKTTVDRGQAYRYKFSKKG